MYKYYRTTDSLSLCSSTEMEEQQANTSCQKLNKAQKPKKFSYGQIRYFMKRLNTALTNRLKEGRPPKYCRLCKAELISISKEMVKKKKQCMSSSKENSQRHLKKPTMSSNSTTEDLVNKNVQKKSGIKQRVHRRH